MKGSIFIACLIISRDRYQSVNLKKSNRLLTVWQLIIFFQLCTSVHSVLHESLARYILQKLYDFEVMKFSPTYEIPL